MTDYKKQYLKYKLKYIKLKGGVKNIFDKKLKRISPKKSIKKPTKRKSTNISQRVLRPACVTTSSGRVVCKEKFEKYKQKLKQKQQMQQQQMQQQAELEWSDDEDDGLNKYGIGSLNNFNKTYIHDGAPNDAFK